jgi:DNA-binding NtrC family response regulator
MQPARILSIGVDSDLLSTRNLVLRRAGYHVASATNLQRATRLLQRVWFDMVILCHAIPKDQREEAVGKIKSVQPNASVIALQAGGEGLDTPVDATIESYNPETLLQSLADILNHSSQAAA